MIVLVDPAPFPAICFPSSPSYITMTSVTAMRLLLSLILILNAVLAEVTIDLAKAVFDEKLGQFCVMQKVTINLDIRFG